MKFATRGAAVVLVLVVSAAAPGQEALYELPGELGECGRDYASSVDRLTLFQRPDLRSGTREVAYRSGWVIPHRQVSDRLTRILSAGILVANRTVELDCSERVDSSRATSRASVPEGEQVSYLYGSEGFVRIKLGSRFCDAQLREFQHIEYPVLQIWARFSWSDGSSPGWLLLDGKQTYVSRRFC